MFRSNRPILLSLAGLLLLGVLVFQIPSVKSRVDWRYEVWSTYLKNAVDPVGKAAYTGAFDPICNFYATASHSDFVGYHSGFANSHTTSTPGFAGCAEISTAGYQQLWPCYACHDLEHVWLGGDQNDIAKVIKPLPQDRNVNPDELRYFVLNQAGWLRAEIRVAGDTNTLKALLGSQLSGHH